MNRSAKPGYFLDVRLVPRVQEYLELNKHKRSIHLPSMAEALRRKYPEYARKKIGPFIISVQKAYQHVLNENPEPAVGDDEYEALSPSVSGLSDLDEAEPESKAEEAAGTNAQLRDLYAKGRKARPESDIIVLNPNAESDDIMVIDTTPSENPETNTPRKFLVPKRSEASEQKKEPPRSGQKRPARVLESEGSQGDQKKKTQQQKLKKASGFSLTVPNATFADIGGNDKTIQEICKLLVHVKHPEVYKEIGVPFPKGILLHGPPGCGKTLFAHAIAGELRLPFFKVASTEIVSGVSGESEEKLRELFDEALMAAPSVLFLDEIDSITPKRETAQREMERRIVAQLLACLDDLSQPNKPSVLVIGATNRPDALDPALRRAGRFDREIAIGIPDENARVRILKVLCKGLKLDDDFDWQRLARLSPGYVGADLMALTREAAMLAVNRVFESLEQEFTTNPEVPSTETVENGELSLDNVTLQEPAKKDSLETSIVPANLLQMLRDDTQIPQEKLKDVKVTFTDFLAAVATVQPSAQREGFATVPGVTWDDVGALTDVRVELQLSILAPVHHPDHFAALGLTTPSGMLLCGPPGCGKTLLAKAVANEAGLNFISVKGPELLNMYVGESERAVRQCFQRARNSSPCVIFFDEIDALCPKRSDHSEGGSSARVVNQLLTEMDGLEARKNVFILGATNRPDILDPAVLRPGRLDKILFVGLPQASDRVEILKALTKNGTKPRLAEDVSLLEIGEDTRCDRFTGADLSALVREASIYALREAVIQLDYRGHLKTSSSPHLSSENLAVSKRHFNSAFQKIKPSVSVKDLAKYDDLKQRYSVQTTVPLATDSGNTAQVKMEQS